MGHGWGGCRCGNLSVPEEALRGGAGMAAGVSISTEGCRGWGGGGGGQTGKVLGVDDKKYQVDQRDDWEGKWGPEAAKGSIVRKFNGGGKNYVNTRRDE